MLNDGASDDRPENSFEDRLGQTLSTEPLLIQISSLHIRSAPH